MTERTFEGFLLTRNWRDTSDGVELEFWFSSSDGPLCILVSGGNSVFFLAQCDLPRAREVLARVPEVDVRALSLRTFEMDAVTGVYFRQHRAARGAADAAQGYAERSRGRARPRGALAGPRKAARSARARVKA